MCLSLSLLSSLSPDVSAQSLAHFHCLGSGGGSAASSSPKISPVVLISSGLHSPPRPSVCLLVLSALKLILFPLHFPSRVPSPTQPSLQLLSPFFCFFHYLSPPPPRVLTGMTGSRLWLQAGRGRRDRAPRTPAAEHPPPQAQHLQACLAPGDSAWPGRGGGTCMGVWIPGPGQEMRVWGMGVFGLGKSGPCGERQWLSVTRAKPSLLVASFFSTPHQQDCCVCVGGGHSRGRSLCCMALRCEIPARERL